MIGNAVPSLLAEMVAWEIRAQLFDEDVDRPARLTLEPPFREDCPDAEALASLPTKYRPLIGDHPAHPGDGKGYGAQRRAA